MTLNKTAKKLIHFLWLKKKYYKYRSAIQQALKNKRSEKRIILIGSPEHENLGDHAISISECNFFKEKFSDYQLIEITNNSYRYAGKYLKKHVNSKDIIIITGGGLMGSLWPEEEKMITDIMLSFYENRIVIMPQTIFFSCESNFEDNVALLNHAINKCKKLLIFCRDASTLDFLKKHTNANAFYMPDMVLYLKKYKSGLQRDYIGICFRKDKESCLSDDLKSYIINNISKLVAIKDISTVVAYHISVSNREAELKAILDEISTCKLLITDRLHAMLFAYITKTPCIAFNNISNKVSGVYAWISDCTYITCVNNKQEFKEALNKLSEIKNVEYDNERLESCFDHMAELIKKYE